MIGQMLEPYRILEKLGEGGMGEVYKARDTRLDRTVAIKVLPPELSADPERRLRFEREARAVAALNHPHICTLFDIGEGAPSGPPSPSERSIRRVEGSPESRFPNSEPVHYLVMEHLAGESLAERLLRGPLPLAQALDIAAQVAEALDAAHKRGIIHRDLKPGNVLLTTGGAGRSGVTTAKLLDFGLAKLAAHGERPALAAGASIPTQAGPVTAEGTILGTLQYMAPEQLEGKEADARSDLWALGAILYEMLTGRRAFEGESQMSLAGKIMNAEPAPLATLQPLTPPSVDRLVRRCLAKPPEERPDTAHDVADDLRWMRDTSGVLAATPVPRRRRARLILAGTGGLVVVALLATFVGWRLRPSPTPTVVRSTIELPAGTRLTGPVFPTRTEFAFSPDGSQLVFSASRDGSAAGAMLYLRALDRADAEPIKGTEGATQPFFSPDANWIGFWASGTLRKVPRRGGITTDLFACEWRPKGAFWTENGTVLFGRGGSGLRRIPADGGAAEELTGIDPKRDAEHTLPFLLPDGRTLLFTVMPDEWGHRARVEAVTISGGTRQVVVDDAADARYLPTGHLVFVRQGVLMAAAFDPSRLAVGPPIPMVQGVEQALNVASSSEHSGAGQFSVSGSGSLAYAAGGVNHFRDDELLWVSRDGRIETLAGFDRSEVNMQVRLSPDGRQLAWVQQAGPLWLFDRERAASTRVSPPEGLASSPRWHPDGRRLTFSWSAAGPGRTWQVTVGDGSDKLEPLAADAEQAWPSSWSPDGRFLALVRSTAETGQDILVYDAQAQKTRPFLQTRSTESFPEFSPDGRWLAYVSNETGRDEVYLRSFPDASRKILVSTQGASEPAWSPDGRELFYVSLPPQKMMRVDLRLSPDVWVGRPQPLFDFAFELCGPIRGYDLDRNGRRFLVTRLRREPVVEITHINLIQNWFEELKAKVPATR